MVTAAPGGVVGLAISQYCEAGLVCRVSRGDEATDKLGRRRVSLLRKATENKQTQ